MLGPCCVFPNPDPGDTLPWRTQAPFLSVLFFTIVFNDGSYLEEINKLDIIISFPLIPKVTYVHYF